MKTENPANWYNYAERRIITPKTILINHSQNAKYQKYHHPRKIRRKYSQISTLWHGVSSNILFTVSVLSVMQNASWDSWVILNPTHFIRSQSSELTRCESNPINSWFILQYKSYRYNINTSIANSWLANPGPFLTGYTQQFS